MILLIRKQYFGFDAAVVSTFAAIRPPFTAIWYSFAAMSVHLKLHSTFQPIKFVEVLYLLEDLQDMGVIGPNMSDARS